jgi:hypothetical protein
MRPEHLYRSEAFAEDLEPARALPRRRSSRDDDGDHRGERAWTAAAMQAWRRQASGVYARLRGAAGRPPRRADWRAEAGAATDTANAAVSAAAGR